MNIKEITTTAFRPVTIQITLETIDEFNALYILGDTNTPKAVTNSIAILPCDGGTIEADELIDDVEAIQRGIIRILNTNKGI